MSCIIEDVLKQISGFDIIRDARTRLGKNHVSKSRARAIQVHEELQNSKMVI